VALAERAASVIVHLVDGTPPLHERASRLATARDAVIG